MAQMIKVENVAKQQQEADEVHALLERLAEEASPEAEALQPELLSRFIKAHQADVAGFRFDCRKFGDFLTLYIDRGGERYATAINLGQCRELRLDEGRCPDMDGAAEFGYSMVKDGAGEVVGCTGMGHYRLSPGWNWNVAYREPWLPTKRDMFRLDPEPQHQSGNMGYGFYNDSYHIKRSFASARPAADDVIRFEGVGASLFAPAGLGAGVYQRILDEMASASLTETP